MEFEVRQAKPIPSLQFSACVLCLAGLLVAMGFTIAELVKPRGSLNSVFLWIFVAVELSVTVLSVCATVEVSLAFAETYVFTKDKLIVKRKNKNKVEIPYSNIDTVEIDKLFLSKSWGISIHCAEPFVKYGMNKYLKRVDGYFKKDDMDKIKGIITFYNAENGDSIKIILK